jgi:hypothetical protein
MKTFTGTLCGPEKAYWKPQRTCKFSEYFLHPMRGGHRRKFTSDREGSW